MKWKEGRRQWSRFLIGKRFIKHIWFKFPFQDVFSNICRIEIIKIDAWEKNGVELFGCITGDGSWVKNLKVENISMKGGNYTGGIIGFADFGFYVEGITLSGKNTVEGRLLIGELPGLPMRILWTARQWQTLRSQMPIWDLMICIGSYKKYVSKTIYPDREFLRVNRNHTIVFRLWLY